ncbi:MAG: hypothetical protein MJ090_01310 [Clostridia bacterium]|nr:hypothetical protein [Clostridia bacterium]
MKKSNKITLCAICSALSVVFMMLGYFPYLTYAVPAVAGIIVMIPFIEIGMSYAFSSYIVSSVLVLFFAEPETKVLYIVLFGYYPIVKAIIEKIGKQAVEWIIKIAVFNSAVAISYFALKLLTNIDVDDFGPLGKYGAVIFVAVCNIAFVLYDIAISRISFVYIYRFRKKINFFFK